MDLRFLSLIATLLFASVCFAGGSVEIENFRMWPAPDHTRVVFDISAPVAYTLFNLEAPHRVVVDIDDARLDPDVFLNQSDHRIARIRSAPRNNHDLRVVLDLNGPLKAKSFLLKPNASYGHRLVIDLSPAQSRSADVAPATQSAVELTRGFRDVVVVIDPGHGGEDPGASGPSRVQEKAVTLAVAKKLKNVIDAERGMRAVLVRTGDYFVRLRKRMQFARDNRADLFISIHADAFRDPRVHGSSVYILSHNGASSEAARWLAEQENAADLVGGVSLDDKDDLLASVLLDLSQTATLNASTHAATEVLKELKQLGKTHKRHVQRAGFVVLKSPDIPSILVEAAFISNPDEERRLTNKAHQDALAMAIMHGVRAYFEAHAPPGTMLALREHKIAAGDTLSGIAERYQVPLKVLKTANALSSDRLQVGKVLRIPDSTGS